ncbi:2-amino-4-hydroxy-6-hydroxymethyldihydropteridine diphosphokinase [Tautonia rosea]|uniref:2-amino-4-hydroxy-6- hydroxymethyldihydropteridine diphosphokinase n=1 Tax=Tautonia rosea TaxID=2728037 RepID=UPI001473AA67|nr:2-amino-4-hydroxy-6-hydroxymethyldihydropteridine diphosphokinase [Tautonia rosea]
MGSTLALIALGSNLGDRSQILDRALAEIAQSDGVVVRGVSRYLETPPVGGPGGQGAFLNAAAALETTLDPFDLHRLLIEVEHHAGRVREVRWDARTLDLDLILFGDQIIDTPGLIVPHPRFAVRRFVLGPLAEVASDAIDPLTRRRVSELRDNLDRRPSYVVLDGASPAVFSRVVAGLSAAGFAWCNWLPEDFDEEAGPERLTGNDASTLLREAARELLQERWSADYWGDRWIVTDLWFDRLAHLPERSTDLDRDAFLATMAELRRGVIPPTFVAATGQACFFGTTAIDPEEPLSRWANRRSSSYSIGYDTPILRIREEIPGSFQERWREAWQAGDMPRAEVLVQEEGVRIAEEILAACEASRAGFGAG